MGFLIGQSKADSFRHATHLQKEHKAEALTLMDVQDATVSEQFRIAGLTQADFERARLSNRWHIGISGVNAWLVLTFKDERLVEV